MTESAPDIEDLGRADLKRLVVRLLEENAALGAEVAALREEIACLKGLKGRPKFKPSGMEKTRERRATGQGGKKRRRGGKLDRLVIDEERVIAAAVPAGSRFKGYEDYVVQELIVRPHVVRFRRERWLTPAGKTILAPLPPGVKGHFGPELRRFVLAQSHRGQVTVPRIVMHLHDLGIEISKRQVVRLLIEGKDDFLAENRAILRAGLETAAWISVDDTGARHKGVNGVTTQIGNDRFAWFATTASKSRRNFLELLRAGHGDYVINAEALDYMRRRKLAGCVIGLLAAEQTKRFAREQAWRAHLRRLGITEMKVHPDPVKIATEGALWGSVVAHGFLPDTVIVSDDAGQFNVAYHALCWVHAEGFVRLTRAHRAHAPSSLHKLDTFTDRQRAAVARIRTRIWWFYADLKATCRDPTHPGAQDGARAALRCHLHRQHRLRHPGPAARPAPCQQGHVVGGARSPRDPAPYQWLGE